MPLNKFLRLSSKPFALKKVYSNAPFAINCGVATESGLDSDPILYVKPRRELMNQRSQWQEGVLFTLSQSASGTKLMNIFSAFSVRLRSVLTNAEFTVLNNTDNQVCAKTRILGAEAMLLHRLKTTRKINFDIYVEILESDTKNQVAYMRASWCVYLVK